MPPRDHDPLADVLALVRPAVVLGAELRAHGRWSLAFDGDPNDVKFGVIVEGDCLFAIQGRTKKLRAGDVFLLGGAPPYVIASNLDAPSQRGDEVIHRTDKPIVRLGSQREKPVVHAIG